DLGGCARRSGLGGGSVAAADLVHRRHPAARDEGGVEVLPTAGGPREPHAEPRHHGEGTGRSARTRHGGKAGPAPRRAQRPAVTDVKPSYGTLWVHSGDLNSADFTSNVCTLVRLYACTIKQNVRGMDTATFDAIRDLFKTFGVEVRWLKQQS